MTLSFSSQQTEKLQTLLNGCRGILLDFDGLLADSEPYHFQAYYEVFKKYGHLIDQDEYWVEFTSKGGGIAGEIERYNLKLDASPEQMRQEKFEIYSRFCNSGEIKLFPEAVKLMELLKSLKPVAIASNSWTHDIRAILKNAGADHLISVIVGKGSAMREKPHPDIFLKTAQKLSVPPQSCLVLEDAEKGLRAAKEGGMRCIIVRNRLNQNIDFSEADLVMPGLGDLVSLLERCGKE